MRFGDLPAQNQPNARAAALGCEERHKQIRRVRQARPFVAHHDLDIIARAFVANKHAARRSLAPRQPHYGSG